MAETRSSSSSRAKSIGHYVLMKTIGEGTFGKVKLGTHILTGERVAVKVLEKDRIQELADVERVAREIHILKLIRRCRHIIQLYEIIETPRQLYLIMEYAPGGELFDYIVEHGRAEEKDACRFLHQILAGVERVHETNVVHRDMKPENLLLDERECIKIVDFGLSNTFQDGQLLQTACGSPCYAAPEMIAGNQYFPPMVDVWSCGVILFALVCGFLPFEDQNHAELYKKILNAEYETPNFVSPEVTSLIAGMLTTDPEKRMSLKDIRKHQWYCQIPESSLMDRDDMENLDEAILDQLDNYGFPREYATKCIQSNKHNHVTTTYYLIREKQLRSESLGPAATARQAIADIDTCFEEHNGPVKLHSAKATPSRPPKAGEDISQKPTEEAAFEETDAPDDAEDGLLTEAWDHPDGGFQPELSFPEKAHPSGRGPAPAPGKALRGVEWASPYGRRPNRRPVNGWTSSPRPPPSARDRRDRLLPGGYGYDRVGGPTRIPPRRPVSTETAPFGRRLCSPWGASRGAYSTATSGELFEEYEVSPPPRRPTMRAMSARATPRPTSYGVPPAAWGFGHRAPEKESSCDDVSCNTSKPPRQVMQEVTQALNSHGISFRQTSNFVVRGQSQGVRFQADILQSDEGGGFRLRFRRASGDARNYKDLCARLLQTMAL